jgi:hypothetical protein
MSLSSKPKKIKPKGTFRELKIVQTVSRKGFDTIKTEEVKTPRRGTKNGPSTSHPNHPSSSPTKRPKLEPFDKEPIPWSMEGPDASGKRQTLVFVYPSWLGSITDNMFKEPKRLLESVLRLREIIFEPPAEPRNAPNRPLL